MAPVRGRKHGSPKGKTKKNHSRQYYAVTGNRAEGSRRTRAGDDLHGWTGKSVYRNSGHRITQLQKRGSGPTRRIFIWAGGPPLAKKKPWEIVNQVASGRIANGKGEIRRKRILGHQVEGEIGRGQG